MTTGIRHETTFSYERMRKQPIFSGFARDGRVIVRDANVEHDLSVEETRSFIAWLTSLIEEAEAQ